MSFFPGKDPEAGNTYQCDAISQVIVPRTVDLGDFAVRRALPSARTRMVGPFIFFDHLARRNSAPATDLMSALTRISALPPLPTCSTARSCTATASARRWRSGPVK